MNSNDSSSRPATSSLRLDKAKIKIYSVRTGVQTGLAVLRPVSCQQHTCNLTSLQSGI